MSVELYNTRVDEGPFDYSHAIIEGLAPKQGLFTPQELPHLSEDEVRSMAGLPYPELATLIIDKFSDLPLETTREICTDAYAPERFKRTEQAPDEVFPYIDLHDGIGVVELFHGPTYAFKDAALQVAPRQMDYVLGEREETLLIAGATSGDTGSASMDGVLSTENMRIVMTSPPAMTDVQKGQMGERALDTERVLNLRVEGVFDDCQDLIKLLKNEPGFEDLGALNSINWARIVAQVPYYFSAYYQASAQQEFAFGEQIDVIVPSGNFGNALAAYIARSMGVPIKDVVIATNENDVLHEMVKSGVYRSRSKVEIVQTDAPSMDIGKASNFERLAYWSMGNDPERLVDFLRASEGRDGAAIGDFVPSGDMYAMSTEQGLASHATTRVDRKNAMRRAYQEHGVFVDPHSATALHAAYDRRQSTNRPQIVMATASIHKFEEEVQNALGTYAELPQRPEDLRDIEQYADNFVSIPNDLDALKIAVSAFRNQEN